MGEKLVVLIEEQFVSCDNGSNKQKEEISMLSTQHRNLFPSTPAFSVGLPKAFSPVVHNWGASRAGKEEGSNQWYNHPRETL